MCFGGRKTREERKLNFALKFTSSAFLRPLWWGMRQRPLATWFHSQLWLVHLNLSASTSGRWIWTRAPIQMDQSELRMKPRCERPLSHTSSQGSQEGRRGEFWGKFFVLHESFGRRSPLIWSKIYWALWNCYFYCDSGLFQLRRKPFVEWRLASDVRRSTEWSVFPFF